MTEEFKESQRQTVKNAKALADGLLKRGFDLVSGGTDNHLLLVDLTNKNITGKDAQLMLDEVSITCNKNGIPFDKQSPFITSGIRLGTAAVTTRGMKEADMDEIAELIALTLTDYENNKETVSSRVAALLSKYPLYE